MRSSQYDLSCSASSDLSASRTCSTPGSGRSCTASRTCSTPGSGSTPGSADEVRAWQDPMSVFFSGVTHPVGVLLEAE